MLGSTLLPTAVHFLIALFAVNLVFSNTRRENAVSSFEAARAKCIYLQNNDKDDVAAAAAGVDLDDRFYAFAHIVLAELVIWGLWLLVVGTLAYALFTQLPDWVQWLLAWLGGPPLQNEVFDNIG